MKNKMYNKIKVILFIIICILIIGCNKVNAAILKNMNDFKINTTHLGDRIYMTRDSKPENSLVSNEFCYCFQREKYFDDGEYKVFYYLKIEEDKVTAKTKNAKNEIITYTKYNPENIGLAYILGFEKFDKGYARRKIYDNPDDQFNAYNTSRQRALWLYGKNWMNANDLPNLNWDVKDDREMPTYPHSYDIDKENISYTSFYNNANLYKSKGAIKKLEISKFEGNQSYQNTANGSILGPFKLQFTDGRIYNNEKKLVTNRVKVSSIDVKDFKGKKIDTGIAFYSDKNCTKKIQVSDIQTGEEFYIKNTSDNNVGSITANISMKKYIVDMWFIKEIKDSYQRALIAKPNTEEETASLTINIKSTGSLYIHKKDGITGDSLKDAGFKIYKNGSGYLKGIVSPYNYVQDIKDATEYTMDDNNKTDFVKYMKYDGNNKEYKDKMILKIDGLSAGTYHVYETKAPTGEYQLELQEGYDEQKGYVDTGMEGIVGEKTEENKYIWNRLVDIKNSQRISISGYVWIDSIPEIKVTDTNNLCEETETKVSGVFVRLMKKGSVPTEIATTTTIDGKYEFKDLINKNELNNYYIEFNYNGTDYKNYIPVEFNATSPNGSKAIVKTMPTYDKDFYGIATTYMGQGDTTKESQYGLEKCGNFNANTRTLENINLGIKEIPKSQYDITQNLASVKITMKGFTYTYVYGGEGVESRIYAPQVKWQKTNDISAYTRSFYPTDISYDKVENTEELKAEVKYRIDIKNTENMNMDYKYKEVTMHLKQLIDEFDANRYTLSDTDHWTAGNVTTDSTEKKKQTAIIKEDYLKSIYDENLGILPNNTTTAYINFSVNHSAILDILNHPDGIIEEYPTKATATAYHEYTRNDYSWDNNILKKQTHYTIDDLRDSEAPYLIFKLGKERTIYGKVFEDKVVTDNGEKIGNGTNEEGENVVKGVKVELLDTTKDDKMDFTKLSVSNLYIVQRENSVPAKEISKIAITETDENGNFVLEGVVPGYYIIRYTYGDGTHKYTDSKGNEVSVDLLSKIRNSEGKEKNVLVKDFKSTIVTSQKAKNALENEAENTLAWYRNLEGENYSVAIDSLIKRKELNKDKDNNIVSDMTDEEIDETKANSSETEKEIMYAKTAKMCFGIENEDAITGNVEITKDDNGKDIQKEEYKNEIKGINFGIIEQPKQKAKIEKVITYVTLTNAQNNVVFDGNPENVKMQGVSDLDNKQNGGSTYVRAEVIEDIIYSSKLELNYDIRVTNVSDVNYYEDKYYLYGDKNGAHEITLKVNEVTDYLDETLKYLPEKSDKDRINTEIKTMKLDDRNTQVLKLNKWENVLFTNKVNDNSRKTTDKVTIVAERTLSREDKDMEIINEAEITGIKHATETGDTNEEKLKIAPSEVHTNGRVKVVTTITPPTGENKQMIIYYAIAGIVALAILSVVIVIIKKKIK